MRRRRRRHGRRHGDAGRQARGPRVLLADERDDLERGRGSGVVLLSRRGRRRPRRRRPRRRRRRHQPGREGFLEEGAERGFGVDARVGVGVELDADGVVVDGDDARVRDAAPDDADGEDDEEPRDLGRDALEGLALERLARARDARVVPRCRAVAAERAEPDDTDENSDARADGPREAMGLAGAVIVERVEEPREAQREDDEEARAEGDGRDESAIPTRDAERSEGALPRRRRPRAALGAQHGERRRARAEQHHRVSR
mmetsp:Transcript_2984/g.11357  ORF Transcript_2984/g.11357 Transcript_2984/m.11357 type:complete len:258 (+) Transcript_2984:412-1185(+)